MFSDNFKWSRIWCFLLKFSKYQKHNLETIPNWYLEQTDICYWAWPRIKWKYWCCYYWILNVISAHSLFFYLSKVVCFINVLGNMELIKFKKKKIENCNSLSADIKKYEATTLGSFKCCESGIFSICFK